MNNSIAITITRSGGIRAIGRVTAYAVFNLQLAFEAGAGAFDEEALYRLTLKPDGQFAGAAWCITIDSFETDGDLVTAVLNTRSEALLNWLGSSRRAAAIELWNDTSDFPVAVGTLTIYPPVQRTDDVPDASEPKRTLTDGQIVSAIEAGATGAHVSHAAAGALSALRVVAVQADDTLEVCDGDNPLHAGRALGVSVTSTGAEGGDVSVLTSGRLEDQSWSWAIGAPVYCGAAGVLTQNPAVPAAFVQQIALADTATSIIIAIRIPILKG